MKGYTKIELTNVHTGEKEVVEKHNIITNNLAEYYKLYAGIGQRAYKYYNDVEPLYEKGMGGIILFSNSLPEDATKFGTLLNSQDDITGCGYNGVNNSTDNKVGNKNLSESKLLNNGYKYVWDFGTSQANGVIAAIGLTHSESGCMSALAYAHPSTLLYDSSSYTYATQTIGYPLYLSLPNVVNYNFTNNTFRSIYIVDTTTIQVVEYKLDITSQHFISGKNPGWYKLSKISETSVTSPYQLTTQGSWINGFDGYYYYISSNNNNTTKVARILASTFAFDTNYGLKSVTNSLLPTHTSTAIANNMAIANGYLYYTKVVGSYDCKLYKVDLATLSKFTQIDIRGRGLEHTVSDGRCIYYAGYLIFPDDSVIRYGYSNPLNNSQNFNEYFVGKENIIPDGMIVISEDRTRFVGIQFKPASTDYKYLIFYFGYFKNNLCTINNLSSSVVKTADKTMKITYTITEGE